MQRKKIIISVVILLTILAIGYFFYTQKIFDAKTVSITLPNNENSITEQAEENTVEIASGEDVVQSEEQNVKSADEKSVEEKKVFKETEDERINIRDNNFSVTNKMVSWGFSVPENKRSIDTIIIHSSYDAIGSDPYSVSGLINEYKSYGVSPHYLIDRQGNTYRLVAEKNIAYHAGDGSTPDGRSGINNFSIGIELMNKKDAKYSDAQYSSLKKLILDIKTRYRIKYVLGHNQIAPDRKTDPWNFEWNKL
jgi:N-acetyl-anhydromuramyl-L-alanine amidase AmpD